MKSKKGQVFDQLGKLATGVAVLAIVLVVTFLIMSQGLAQMAEIEGVTIGNTTAYTVGMNGTVTLTEAVSTIPGWVPLVIIAAIGAILLGLVSLFRRR